LLLADKPRIAVLSPFLDKRHGTERCIAEQVERLAARYEIHVYSMRVQEVDTARVVWRRIPDLPGPHLLRFLWWFAANHLWRWWDRRFGGFVPDLVYSPGPNSLDADVISVHIVFGELHHRVKKDLSLLSNPLTSWPQLIHRRAYYRLAEFLERRVYTNEDIPMAVVSRRVAANLAERYARKNDLRVVYHGWDTSRFSPQRLASLRAQSRQALGVEKEDFCVLLIGNDWNNKGLPSLLEAAGQVERVPLQVLAVGRDMPDPYRAAIARCHLADRVRFLPPRADVEFYYAAADAYVGPSLEDAFALPPLEAMACGLPVIVSSQAGVSELITDGVDGLVLADPRDAASLAKLISSLAGDSGLRKRLGENARKTACQYTWDRNAEQLGALFDEALAKKG
jgi:glycosyltransferase involved in cell wall biosynthesis